MHGDRTKSNWEQVASQVLSKAGKQVEACQAKATDSWFAVNQVAV